VPDNALTSINGFADTLLTRLPADEPARTCAETIKQAGVRAVALVNTLAPPIESSPAVQAPDSSATAQAA